MELTLLRKNRKVYKCFINFPPHFTILQNISLIRANKRIAVPLYKCMMIDVDRVKENGTQFVFEVLLDENDRVPPFTVMLDKQYHAHLTGGAVSPEMLVEKSFVFLVERGTKRSNHANIQSF